MTRLSLLLLTSLLGTSLAAPPHLGVRQNPPAPPPSGSSSPLSASNSASGPPPSSASSSAAGPPPPSPTGGAGPGNLTSQFKTVVVFGSGYEDNGNGTFRITNGSFPTEPYYDGRFTNGLVWVEDLANRMSARVLDFAIAGSTTNNSLVQGFTGPNYTIPAPSLLDQVAAFINLVEAAARLSTPGPEIPPDGGAPNGTPPEGSPDPSMGGDASMGGDPSMGNGPMPAYRPHFKYYKRQVDHFARFNPNLPPGYASRPYLFRPISYSLPFWYGHDLHGGGSGGGGGSGHDNGGGTNSGSGGGNGSNNSGPGGGGDGSSSSEPATRDNTLFVIGGVGATDVFFNQTVDPRQSVDSVINAAIALSLVGAKHFLITSTPALERAPYVLRNSSIQGPVTDFTKKYQGLLQSALQSAAATGGGATTPMPPGPSSGPAPGAGGPPSSAASSPFAARQAPSSSGPPPPPPSSSGPPPPPPPSPSSSSAGHPSSHSSSSSHAPPSASSPAPGPAPTGGPPPANVTVPLPGGASVTLFDQYGFFLNTIDHAPQLGLNNTDAACLAGAPGSNISAAQPCPNPDAYFWFDDVHPSAHVHRLLADAVFDALGMSNNTKSIPPGAGPGGLPPANATMVTIAVPSSTSIPTVPLSGSLPNVSQTNTPAAGPPPSGPSAPPPPSGSAPPPSPPSPSSGGPGKPASRRYFI